MHGIQSKGLAEESLAGRHSALDVLGYNCVVCPEDDLNKCVYRTEASHNGDISFDYGSQKGYALSPLFS